MTSATTGGGVPDPFAAIDRRIGLRKHLVELAQDFVEVFARSCAGVRSRFSELCWESEVTVSGDPSTLKNAAQATLQRSGPSMNIIGVSSHYHDSAACLLSNGVLVAAAQEER